MKRSTILTGAGALGAAALVFVFFGTGSHQGACSNLVAEPANAGLAKKAVREYRTSGAWNASIVCDVEKAKKLLAQYTPAAGERPAAIFDVDDTALSIGNLSISPILDICMEPINCGKTLPKILR